MLRAELKEDLKKAMKAKDERAVATLRLVLAALKDRDIAARGQGNLEGVDDTEILGILQSMIRQRRESMELYENGGRSDLAEQESQEIEIIQRFLPEPLTDSQMAENVAAVIEELEAKSLKDMGRTMAVLRERFAGRMDFAKASALVKEQLS